MKSLKKLSNNKNPDVLNFLANLSNDQVFTPTKIAKRVIDELPKHIWTDPNLKILDPVCKTGVFLREASKRLNEGLKNKFKNEAQRIKHILTNQIYGIATTEITSLIARRSIYYSINANGKHSVCKSFENDNGNITFNNSEHEWSGQNCKFCGASKLVWERDDSLEKYASEFIHTNNPENLFPNMKFDVIIGNPPYQLSDGGHSRSASTIYHLFIENAKKLNPRFLTMIVPSRWFVGGKGLDGFRNNMLKDRRIKKIVDFENSNQVFQGPDITGGVNYFLWDRDYNGKCEFVSVRSDKEVSVQRYLDEYEILIRDANAISILKKIEKININNNLKLSSFVSPRKPFNLPTNYPPKQNGVPCWFIQKIGLKFANKTDIIDSNNFTNKWKLLIPKAPIAGQTDFSKPVGFYYHGNVIIAKPGEICTESWIVAGAFDTEKETKYFRSYLFTKIIRFLLLQAVISQDVTRKNFMFVPHLGKYDRNYTDDFLIKEWQINDEDWKYIDSRITLISDDQKSIS